MYGNSIRDDGYITSLLDFIKLEYGFEAQNVIPAKRGYYGETWRLDTSDDSYFVKLDYSPHKGIYERSFPVLENLRKNGIELISRVVKTADGRLSTRFDGAVLGVFDWIDGENVQNEQTKMAEYQMLARIYTVPPDGLVVPCEDFSGKSADAFLELWERLADTRINTLLEQNRGKLKHCAERLKKFAALCRNDFTGFVITHGDAGGNMIKNGERYSLVDWDAPMLAPPERDAWFCLHLPWAMDAFHDVLHCNGLGCSLRPERLAYYCYHYFFFYMNEVLETYFDIGDGNGSICDYLREYFGGWIEENLRFAEEHY